MRQSKRRGLMVELTQIVVAVVALYGAFLSTLNAVQNWKRDKIRIRVNLSWGLFSSSGTNKKGYIIEIFNPGEKLIYIQSIIAPLPNKEKMFYAKPIYDKILPSELKPQKKISVIWEEEDFKNCFAKPETKASHVRVYVTDAMENKYFSNFININTNRKYGRIISFAITKTEKIKSYLKTKILQ